MLLLNCQISFISHFIFCQKKKEKGKTDVKKNWVFFFFLVKFKARIFRFGIKWWKFNDYIFLTRIGVWNFSTKDIDSDAISTQTWFIINYSRLYHFYGVDIQSVNSSLMTSHPDKYWMRIVCLFIWHWWRGWWKYCRGEFKLFDSKRFLWTRKNDKKINEMWKKDAPFWTLTPSKPLFLDSLRQINKSYHSENYIIIFRPFVINL